MGVCVCACGWVGSTENHDRTQEAFEAELAAAAQQHEAVAEEAQHQVVLLELENRSLLERMAMYDIAEVEEHNRELRQQVLGMKESRLVEQQTLDCVKQQQRTAVAQLRCVSI